MTGQDSELTGPQTTTHGPWRVTRPADGPADACGVDLGAAPAGQDALRLAVHAKEVAEAVEQQCWPAAGGRAYCLSMQIRTALSNAYGQLRLRWLAADGSAIRQDGSSYTFLEHDYAPLHIWAVAPQEAVMACAGVRLTPGCPELYVAAGTLWMAPAQFAPSLLLDASPRATAALFDTSLPVEYSLAVRGAPVELRQITAGYALTNYAEHAIAKGSVSIELTQGEGRTTLSLPPLPPGYYELSLTAEGEGISPFRVTRTLGCLPPLGFSPAGDSPISLDAGLSWPTDGGADERRSVTAAAACAKVGLRALRERMAWRAVNPARGQFDWGSYRKNADIQRAHGLDVYPVFHDTPKWAQVAADDDKANYPPDDPRTVYEFTRRMTLDLGAAVRYFELWNEPDIFFFGGHPWDLAAIIKAGYLGIKDADPTVGVLNASRCAGPEFWRCLLANGVGPYFDIWNQHSYGAPEDLFTLVQEDRDLMAAAGIDRPIWMSEMGRRSVPDRDGTYNIPERLQVCYLLRAYACGLAAGLDRFMYFYLQEFLEYGVNLWGLQRANLDPKPAFVALATLIRQCQQANVIGMLQEGKRYGIVFGLQGGDCVALAWSLEGSPLSEGWGAQLPQLAPGQSWSDAEGTFDLPVKAGAMLVNAVGEKVADLRGPTATVKLSAEPVFVHGVDASRLAMKPVPKPLRFVPSAQPPQADRHVWLQAVSRPKQTVNQADAQQQKLALHFAPGQSEKIEFRVHNWGRTPASVQLDIACPQGWASDTPGQLPLEVPAQETRCVVVRLVPRAGIGRTSSWIAPCSVQATLMLNGRPHDQARIDYVIDLEKTAVRPHLACSSLQPAVADIQNAQMPPTSLVFAPIPEVSGQLSTFNDVRSFHVGKHGLLYIEGFVDRANDEDGFFLFGVDGPAKAWVNGCEVDCRPEAVNPAIDGQYAVPVKWQKGENRIVVAMLTNHGKAWGMYARAASAIKD